MRNGQSAVYGVRSNTRPVSLPAYLLLAITASLMGSEDLLLAQPSLSYYFAHIAAADVWRTTFTYVNGSAQTVTCNTLFFSDSGGPLTLLFNGNSLSSTND